MKPAGGGTMKKLYWIIQQAEHLGGTEIVTINIVNMLAKHLDVTLLVVGEENKELDFGLDKDVKVEYLGVPYKYTCLEDYTGKLRDKGKHLSVVFTGIQCGLFWFFKRFKFRKMLKKRIDKDDLLICSSYDNFMIAPRGRNVLFHFHFNAKFFFSLMVSTGRLFHRKPNKYIFLTKDTLKTIVKKKKKYSGSYQVYNPIRFDRCLDLEYHNNEILFLARYSPQKNPMLALAVAKELSQMMDNFHLSMYGKGFLKEKMEKYVADNRLEKYVTINDQTNDALSVIHNSDLLLVTSDFEGSCLVVNEAASQSVPAVSSNWGDAAYEVVDHGNSGFVVDSKDPKEYAKKIKEILEDKDYLLKLKQNAYDFSDNFSDENIVRNWLEIINKY